MQQGYPFQPSGTGAATTLNIAVTGSSQQLTIPLVPNDGSGAVRLVNSGSQVVFWCFGNFTAAVATSTPMLPNTVETFTVPPYTTQISVIAAGTGSTLYVTVGKGA